MNKYNFDMDLSENTSTGLIVKKLKPGMKVLEFGCSFGRMTRFMCEEMNCDVYIVEIDDDAYKSAIKYARDGVCGDILEYEWAEKFKDIRFDAILFADVLEHLSEPCRVLKTAGELLSDEGKIVVSIPNITHNDIILKAISNHFDYTKVGLLDDTHIHFWGLDNLEDLAKDANLYISSVEATYVDTGNTEQFSGKEPDCSHILMNILKERSCGEVYQFVIFMQKRQAAEEKLIDNFANPFIYSHIYLDRGQGFNDEDIISVKSVMSESGVYNTKATIEDTENLRFIRFDPIEFQQCIISDIRIRQDANTIEPQFVNAIIIDDIVLLRGRDPQIIVEIIPGGGEVNIDAEIVLPGDRYIELMEEKVMKENQRLEDKIEEMTIELRSHLMRLDDQDRELRLYLTRIDKQDKEIRSYLTRINKQDNELERMKEKLEDNVVLLNSYRSLADSKDMYIVKLDKRINELESLVEHYQRYPLIRLGRFIGNVISHIYTNVRNAIART